MKTTIVIPNYNGISYLRECVKSLREDLKNHPAAVIIVDNGSEDGSVEWIKQECPDITLIPLKKNTGFPEYEKYEPSGAGKACRNDCVHA